MMSANIPNAKRKAIYRRDNFLCVCCGDNRGLQLHHFIARSRGGSDSVQNLVTLCWRCHATAHGMRFNGYLDESYIFDAIVEYLSDIYEDWSP